MKMTKNPKRALLLSALSLVLCISMLVGTTFAWFTDSVSSGRNKIVAGNLDVVLEYKNSWDEAWKPVTNDAPVFQEGTLYEPGYTEVVYLRVSNAGSLALKYNLSINIDDEKSSTNVLGEKFWLSDYLKIGTYVQDEFSGGFNYADILMPGMFGTREAALSNVVLTTLYDANSLVCSNSPVLPGDETAQVIAIVLTMPESVGNEANYNKAYNPPEITLGINLVATQMNYENDNYGSDYDQDAQIPKPVNSYWDMAYDRGNSGEYFLTSDIDADDFIYFGDNTNNTIHLNGNKINAKNETQWLFVGQGANCVLTITGEGNINANMGIYASSNGTVNIDGGDFTFGETDKKYHVYVQNSATVVINDGTFVSQDANTAIIYCINGFVEINGGFFQNTANSNQALLSMGDNIKYKDNQKITLSGGTFVNWNPMDSAFARPWTNPDVPAMIVLADGYQMISETQENGDIWYMVVPV